MNRLKSLSMKMISKEKLRKYRKVKGLSQEGLSEVSGISVRTIQRLEMGLSNGSPYTLKSLAKALDIENADLLTEEAKFITSKPDEVGKLRLMNLSALSIILLPLGNIILPTLTFWKYKSDVKVNTDGRKVLSFQLLWILFTICFLLIGSLILTLLFPPFRGSRIPAYLLLYFVSVLLNVFFTIQATIQLNDGKPFLNFVPKIF